MTLQQGTDVGPNMFDPQTLSCTQSNLEQENTSLKEQVKTLKDSVERLKRQLCIAESAHKKNTKVSKKYLNNYSRIQIK